MTLPLNPPLRLFEFQAKNYFGLSIKDTSLALVQISTSNHHLNQFSYLNLSPGIIQNGEIKNSPLFLQSLKKLLTSSQTKTSFVIYNLPETKVFSKIVEVPKIPDAELEEAVSWQAEDQIPLDIAKTYYDFKILEKEEKKTKIYLVAAPSKNVDNLTALIQQAGLTPVAIEPSSLALTRLIDLKIKNPVLLVEIESPSTILSLAHKGTILSGASFDTPQDSQSFEKEFTAETLRLREFCQKKFKTDFNSVLFFGDLSLRISQTTLASLKLQALSPLINIKNPPAQFTNKFQSLALAYALGQKKASPPSDVDTVNLLPPSLQGIYDLKEKHHFFSKTCLFLNLFFIILTFCLSSTFTYLFLNLKKLESDIKIATTQGANGEAILIEKTARQINSKSNQIIALSTQSIKTSSDLVSINELIPANFNITSLSFDYAKNLFSLTGMAPKREDVIKLNESLQASKIFHNPQIPLKSLEKKENVEFTLEFQKNLKP